MLKLSQRGPGLSMSGCAFRAVFINAQMLWISLSPGVSPAPQPVAPPFHGSGTLLHLFFLSTSTPAHVTDGQVAGSTGRLTSSEPLSESS